MEVVENLRDLLLMSAEHRVDLVAQGIVPLAFDQVLVNEYLPGQGIALHLDYEPFDRVVASLSLLSDCVMDFRRVRDGCRESLLPERRSLLAAEPRCARRFNPS